MFCFSPVLVALGPDGVDGRLFQALPPADIGLCFHPRLKDLDDLEFSFNRERVALFGHLIEKNVETGGVKNMVEVLCINIITDRENKHWTSNDSGQIPKPGMKLQQKVDVDS